MSRAYKAPKADNPKIPPPHDWRTTDEDEINKRRLRARAEPFVIMNGDPSYPIYSNFSVRSKSGLEYAVEIRDLEQKRHCCTCVDFRVNGLGTCKHIEGVLAYLEARFPRLFKAAREKGSPRLEIVLDPGEGALMIENRREPMPFPLRRLFDQGRLRKGWDCEEAVQWLEANSLGEVRISQEVHAWLESRRREAERTALQREYEFKVQDGEWPAQETLAPLFPYQREGMLHLAFRERSLLADEMGLGKTIQAIAACALLHRLGRASRVLVVTPASLKTEWEEQIQRFTPLPFHLVYGTRSQRMALYKKPSFFNIVNYEQMVKDALDVNRWLRPDVVILDEAQRIKNWNTQTAQAIKRLASRYAFVLTGTPIENRIDELHSLMSFLNPSVLGPLFRFNREYYVMDERGRPTDYQNLEQLHQRIRPYMLRRRKSDVETELPERTDQNYLLPMSRAQWDEYRVHEAAVGRLMNAAKRRPLSPREQDKLMRELAMMRMICDSNYILNPEDRHSPKVNELERILEECLGDGETKAIVFSEWERMLELVRERCEKAGFSYAYHTGSVPQKRRRAEIQTFKEDPACRVFLSTDSGSTGLNLQNANIVINCDLPWNPAKLEQRIARAWRKYQRQAVTVINLVAENTLEHRMLGTLASKQALADGVIDHKGDLDKISFRGGRQAAMERLEQLLGSPALQVPPPVPTPSADPSLAFSQEAALLLGPRLLCCEERFQISSSRSLLLLVVEQNPAIVREQLAPVFERLFGPAAQSSGEAPSWEVIDRSTDEALQRMIQSGIITPQVRATRALYPVLEPGTLRQSLSTQERERANKHRGQAARKLKIAQLLFDGELLEEARQALEEGVLCIGRALAVEQRQEEPADVKSCLLPPLAQAWKESESMVRRYLEDPQQLLDPVLQHMNKLATTGTTN